METNILRFEHPEYLYWLLIIPILIAIYVTIRIINKRQFQKFADTKFAELLTPLVSKSRSNQSSPSANLHSISCPNSLPMNSSFFQSRLSLK